MRLSILFLFVFIISCTKTVPRMPINPKPSTTLLSETLSTSKALNKIEDDTILDYIKKDTVLGYIESKQGFWYAYITKKTQNSPTPVKGDRVVLAYEISDLQGNIIYSEDDLGLKEYHVDKEDFITGLQKGIKLMKEGETISFIIPSYSAFGVTGDGNKIKLNQTIKSKVTLINIK